MSKLADNVAALREPEFRKLFLGQATSIVVTKAIGIGLAVAVALDATVIRVLMVPAAMRLLGRWNWWMPTRLERLVANRLPRSEAEVEAAVR